MISMRSSNIVIGQRIDSAKAARAAELRHQMTPEEKVLWRQLRANRLHGHHFRRQQVIDGFIVDFYCHQAGLVIELDGAVHDGQADYDRERDRVLSARGLRVVRIRNDEVHQDVPALLSRIAALCEGV